MKKLKSWLSERENRILCGKLAVALFFPFLLCVLYCLREGAWIGQLHFASAQNNDNLFYYKQVEGMVKYGIPQGYFGFNESAAEVFSFAAWSPVALFPWALWGLIFGWNYASLLTCNIFLLSLVLTLTVYWVRPGWKQMLFTAVMFATFPPVTRYLMSCLAETLMVTFVLLFYGLALGYAKRESRGKLIGMFAVAGYLTWIRPYMVLLLLLPGVFLFLKSKKRGLWVTGTTMITNLVAYFVISAYFTADYFQGLYNFSLFSGFREYGVFKGMYQLLLQVLRTLDSLLYTMKLSLTEGSFLGSNYCVLALLILLTVLLTIRLLRRKEEKLQLYIVLHYVITVVISTAALLLLMQKMNETSRHIMSFVAAGMLLLGCITVQNSWKEVWKPLLVGLLCLLLYHIYPDDGQDYQVPILMPEKYEEEQNWLEINDQIVLETEETPSFANTVIWVYADEVEGASERMSWQHMLSLPEGMGISCCSGEFLVQNWNELKSRYITTLVNGEIAKLCEESGYEKIGEANGKVLYKRY